MIKDWVTMAPYLQAMFLKQESFHLPSVHPVNLVHFLWHFQIHLVNDHLSQTEVSSRELPEEATLLRTQDHALSKWEFSFCPGLLA